MKAVSEILKCSHLWHTGHRRGLRLSVIHSIHVPLGHVLYSVSCISCAVAAAAAAASCLAFGSRFWAMCRDNQQAAQMLLLPFGRPARNGGLE